MAAGSQFPLPPSVACFTSDHTSQGHLLLLLCGARLLLLYTHGDYAQRSAGLRAHVQSAPGFLLSQKRANRANNVKRYFEQLSRTRQQWYSRRRYGGGGGSDKLLYGSIVFPPALVWITIKAVHQRSSAAKIIITRGDPTVTYR